MKMKIRSEKSCSKTIPECFSLELKLMYLILCTTYMYFYHFFLMYSVRGGKIKKEKKMENKIYLVSLKYAEKYSFSFFIETGLSRTMSPNRTITNNIVCLILALTWRKGWKGKSYWDVLVHSLCAELWDSPSPTDMIRYSLQQQQSGASATGLCYVRWLQDEGSFAMPVFIWFSI